MNKFLKRYKLSKLSQEERKSDHTYRKLGDWKDDKNLPKKFFKRLKNFNKNEKNF